MSIAKKIIEYCGDTTHASGTIHNDVLVVMERILPKDINTSLETGCGKSTILFSNILKKHFVFTIDDRHTSNSSINFFQHSPLTQNYRIVLIPGPTQITLPHHTHEADYDFVFLDGPHAFPFPQLEYYHLYQHIKRGGVLILDDINIPTIGELAAFLYEDAMWELMTVVHTTAIFRRTDAETFCSTGDGWQTQEYNKRRFSAKIPFLPL
jgi:predicted O-methyltransferase YrrM